MANAVTAPVTHVHSKEARSGAQRNASIEERTAVLETRWEETVPTLATQADLRGLETRLTRWGIGAGLALFTAFAAMFIANTARIDRLDGKLDQLAARMDARMDALDAKLDVRFDALMAEIRALRK